MLKKYFVSFAFASLMFSASSALARAPIIGKAANSGGENSTCRIIFRDSQNHLRGECSGTLTDDHTITTAAHCLLDVLPEKQNVTIECGYQGQDRLPANPNAKIDEALGDGLITEGIHFKETRTGVKYQIARDYQGEGTFPDVGQITLSAPIDSKSITPARVGDSLDKIAIFYRSNGDHALIRNEGVECKMEGYGINGKEETGGLYQAPLDASQFVIANTQKISFTDHVDSSNITSVELSEEYDHDLQQNSTGDLSAAIRLMNFYQKNKMIEAITTLGDSGGPLYCQNQTSGWTLFAVNSGGLFNSYFFNNDWSTLAHPELISLEAWVSPAVKNK
jgi:hypothetical protein